MSCCSASSLDSSSLFPLIWSALLLRKPVVFQVQRVHLHQMMSVCTTRLSSIKSRLSMIYSGSLTSFYPMKHSTLMDIPSWASTRTVPPCPREHPGPSVRGIDVPRPTCFREHGEVPDVDVLNGILVNDASLDDMLFVVIFRTSWAQKAPRYDGDDEVCCARQWPRRCRCRRISDSTILRNRNMQILLILRSRL